MTELSAVILAKTDSDANFRMTSDCIRTLRESEPSCEVIVVESIFPQRDENWTYPKFVKVIYPKQPFNFHKFLNIGIEESSGEFVALLNNDLIFEKDWFSEIRKVASRNPQIRSFSPSPFPETETRTGFETGYKVRTHISGWCIVARRNLFNKIGKLDERFEFNYADNDYAMTLKKYDIRHAVVFGSRVIHLENERENKGEWYELRRAEAELSLSGRKLPRYLMADAYRNFFSDKKGLEDHLKFHGKWGSPTKLYRKNKIADWLLKSGFGFLNRIVLSL